MLIIKGFIIGLGKILPGVSGAVLAINLGIYQKLLNSITNFFNAWKNNLKFLLLVGVGGLIAIIFGSKVLIYLLANYKFITMMFFVGLITGGTYNFGKNIKYSYKSIIVILMITSIFSLLSLNTFNNNYLLSGKITDYLILFLGGFIEIFASIVPGISATSLLMIIGIYDIVLKMTANIYNLNYVLSNINLYICYGAGMLLSFIINIYLINYLLKKYHNQSYSIIFGLAISSIIFLIVMTFKTNFSILQFILGIILLVLGMLLSNILDK